MDLAARFGTDKKKEVEGVWYDMGDGCRLRVARKGNRRYTEKYQQLDRERSIVRRAQLETLGDEEGEKVLAELIAHAILVDWEGVKDNGKEIPYSTEAAYEQLVKYPDFRVLVTELSEQQAMYRAEQQKADVKNSKKS